MFAAIGVMASTIAAAGIALLTEITSGSLSLPSWLAWVALGILFLISVIIVIFLASIAERGSTRTDLPKAGAPHIRDPELRLLIARTIVGQRVVQTILARKEEA